MFSAAPGRRLLLAGGVAQRVGGGGTAGSEIQSAVAQSIGSFRGDAKFTTWLHQLARNRAVDHLRRVRSAEPLDAHDYSAAVRLSSMVASQLAVRQLLDELPDRYRDAVLLRDVERLPYEEVATRLGRNANTVKSHVARGRALLAGLIERDSGGG